jgi:hypothetical protein
MLPPSSGLQWKMEVTTLHGARNQKTTNNKVVLIFIFLDTRREEKTHRNEW